MNDLQCKNYGFSYQFGGHEFCFTVVASTDEEAISKHLAMCTAVFVGEMKEHIDKPNA